MTRSTIRLVVARFAVVLIALPAAACGARQPVGETGRPSVRAEQEDQVMADTPPRPAPRPGTPDATMLSTGPSTAPPKPKPPRPGDKISPSPWQPPAVIDLVRPEVGNETPG
jgi:hypothetical protein